jgi:hypothetical protein
MKGFNIWEIYVFYHHHKGIFMFKGKFSKERKIQIFFSFEFQKKTKFKFPKTNPIFII